MAVNMLCREVVTPLVSPQPSLSSFRAGAAVEDNEQEFMCMYIRGGRSLHFSRMQDNECRIESRAIQPYIVWALI